MDSRLRSRRAWCASCRTQRCASAIVWKSYESRSDLETELSLDRVIEEAAPCAVSAIATGTSLRVLFDQPLSHSLPEPGDFVIDDEAGVAGVVGIEGAALSLELVPPGVRSQRLGASPGLQR